jgi:type IV fimbrial biogenesis protein FimT
MLKTPLKVSGFTLIELIITVTIVGILTVIAIPTFNTVISSNRLTVYSNEFVGALNLARSEAVKRGTQVTVRRLGPTTTNWQWGWEVFVDIAGQPAGNTSFTFMDDNDGIPCEVDTNGAAIEDCLLRAYSEPPKALQAVAFLPKGFTFISNATLADAIGFTALGRSIIKTGPSKTGPGDGTLILCDTNRSAQKPTPQKPDRLKSAKVIILTGTGRVRLGVDSDNDGVPEKDNGTNISNCTTP